MKLAVLKTEKQLETRNDRVLHIQTYGKNNDYPQRLMEVVDASITGGGCLDNYARFIMGRGFRAQDFFSATINDRGDTADDVLSAVSYDLARFGGFCLHVNYNALFEVTSVTHMPFEWVRFEELDSNYQFARLAVHPDWGRRYRNLRPFRVKDITWFDFFDPRPEAVTKGVERAGGWDKWNGQLYYYSRRGPKAYPIPIYDAALTDMSAEAGLSNLSYRNIRNNYFPAGMFIDHNNNPNSKEQEDDTREELSQFQGDTNAGLMLYINLQEGDQEPEFKPFETKNTDKEFKESSNQIPDRIGSAFLQPPILRAKDVGSNFGATAMREAYDFYNAQTETERLMLERSMRDVFRHFAGIDSINPEDDYSILPKVYRVNSSLAEQLGDRTVDVLDLLFDDSKSEAAKRTVLARVFGLEAEDIDELINSLS